MKPLLPHKPLLLTAPFLLALLLTILTILTILTSCSSGGEDAATTTSTTQPVGPDTNTSSIVVDDWDNKAAFCDTAAALEQTPQGDTVDNAAVYAAVYAQTIRDLGTLGPDDSAFVTTMNTVKWAAETIETAFAAGVPENVAEGDAFGYFARQSESVQGSPGVRSATGRLNAFLVSSCGFSLGGSPSNPNLPSNGDTEPSAVLQPPTRVG